MEHVLLGPIVEPEIVGQPDAPGVGAVFVGYGNGTLQSAAPGIWGLLGELSATNRSDGCLSAYIIAL